MTSIVPQTDAFRRWAQLSGRQGVQLVRLLAGEQGNVYTACPLELDEEGLPQRIGSLEFPVTNIGEPAGGPPSLPAETDAVALDVEGLWVVFVRPGGPAAFPAKVTEAFSGVVYSLKEQMVDATGAFIDRPGAATVTGWNLAELSLGPGSAVEVGTIVLATASVDAGTPPTVRYLFDHPVYAKYLP